MLSRPEVLQIIVHAIGSFVVGGLFALGNVVARKKVGDKLIVDTTVLQHTDNTMFVLLHELQLQTRDTIGLIRLIGVIDRVLSREVKLETDRNNIDLNTRLESERDYTLIKAVYFDRLRTHFREQHINDLKLVEDYEALCLQIITRLFKHLERIWILTEKSKQNTNS